MKYIAVLVFFIAALVLFSMNREVTAHDESKLSKEPIPAPPTPVPTPKILPQAKDIFSANIHRLAVVRAVSKRMQREPGGLRTYEEEKFYNGFFVDQDGLMLISVPPNTDFVDNSFRARPTASNKEYSAVHLGKDRQENISFVRVELPPNTRTESITFAKEVTLSLGDEVTILVHYGKVFSFAPKFTTAKINSFIKNTRGRKVIALDLAPADLENCLGGVVFDKNGQAVGVIALDEFAGPDNRGQVCGMLLPAPAIFDMLKRVPPPPVKEKEQGWLGVRMQPLTGDMAEALGAKGLKGVVVAYVVPNSPAKKAGLEIGDVIIRFANQRVDCPTNEAVMQMSERIRSAAVNSQQQLVVFRNGREKVFEAQITPRPERNQELKNTTNEFFGLTIEELSIGLAMEVGLPDRNAVYVKGLIGGGRAQLGGLRQQDLILKINGQDVQDFNQAVRLLNEAQAKDKDGVLLFVRSQAGSRFVNISTQ